MPCEAWDTAAETIGKYLVKGSQILIEGALKNESWEQDGQKRSRTKIRVTTFQMLGGKRSEDSPKPEPTEASNKEDIPDDNKPKDDVPF